MEVMLGILPKDHQAVPGAISESCDAEDGILVTVNHMTSSSSKDDVEAARVAETRSEQEREYRKQHSADMTGAMDRVRSPPVICKGSGQIFTR